LSLNLVVGTMIVFIQGLNVVLTAPLCHFMLSFCSQFEYHQYCTYTASFRLFTPVSFYKRHASYSAY